MQPRNFSTVNDLHYTVYVCMHACIYKYVCIYVCVCMYCSYRSIDFNGNILGVAPLGTMCRGRRAAGLMQDTGSSVAFVGGIAAHELGHIFNMEHDDECK